MRPVLAVCPRTLSEHAPFAEALPGFTLRLNRTGRRLEGDGLRTFLDGATHAVVGLERIEPAWLPTLSLRVVAKYGVGLDTLPLSALDAAGVRVGWTPGVNRIAAAELALGLTLGLLRDLGEQDRRVRAGEAATGWRPPLGRELSTLTVGVVGCGHVGLEVVKRLRAFGANVLVNDIRDRAEHLAAMGVRQVEWEVLLRSCDVLTLHVPLTSRTRHLLDGEALALCPRGVRIVNVARGELIDEDALLAGLSSGHVAGAGLDVRATEPPDRDPLSRHRRVLSTVHAGGSTRGAVRSMAAAAAHNVLHPTTVTELRERLALGAIEPLPEPLP